jgi:hypothetical protein
MAIIPQPSFLPWNKIDRMTDIDRLAAALSILPDEELISHLEAERGNGRDDYPIRPLWNSVIAMIIFQHPSVESLRRELDRNDGLLDLCGFDPAKGSHPVPPHYVYSRFFAKVMEHQELIDKMFDGMVEKIRTLLPDFGKHLAIDGKAIPSAGKPNENEEPDGRRETDADHGAKTYYANGPNGETEKKTKWWFGFKLHLVIDAVHELPVGYTITKASVHDSPMLKPVMAELKKKHPELLEGAEDISADRGYDSADNNASLMDDYKVKPIIDIRHMWKDGETTRLLNPDAADNIVYDQDGTIYCIAQSKQAPNQTEKMEMAFCGFEKDREAVKYRCPAAAFGFECPERDRCGKSEYGRVVRVPLDLDRRLFIPTPRSTPKFERLYNKRTAVERVNGRIDCSFGFEHHFIRGMKKMKLRMSLVMIIMLVLAAHAVESEHQERMRSLVWSVPTKAA